MNVLGIDIGGTKVALGLVDQEGRVRSREVFASEASDGRDILFARIVARAKRFKPDAVGIGFPGPVRPRDGVVQESVNLPGWAGTELSRTFEEALDCPVRAQNDANAAALGEWLYGAGRGTTEFVYLTISTGIGSGLVSGSGLLIGWNGYAGEVGHCILQRGGPLCSCGKHGCWEALASGTAIGRMGRERAKTDRAGILLQEAGGRAEDVTAKTVFAAARQGDEGAQRILDQTADWTALGLHNLCIALNPQRIALGGGVGLADPAYRDAIGRRLRSYGGMQVQPELVAAELGADVGVIGAASLVRTDPHRG